LKNVGSESVMFAYLSYACVLFISGFSRGSIHCNNAICAVSDVHPFAIKLVNVVPLLCILSKSGKLSKRPHDLLESTVENDSAKTKTTFNFFAFPATFLK
jgi:hypothetical protein